MQDTHATKRGRVVESMHVALSRNETHQKFKIWVYADEGLVRGSGLTVGEAGISANHDFLAHKDGSSFRFTEGSYRMEVFAQLLGDRERIMLFSQSLEISREVAAQMRRSFSVSAAAALLPPSAAFAPCSASSFQR